jgi:Tfp pilus assembly PilM family ATPase
MVSFLKKQTRSRISFLPGMGKCQPIGIDMGDEVVKMVQLADNGHGIELIAGESRDLPEDIKAGSSQWQRWAIEAISELAANGRFRGRDVIAAISARDVFIEHVKMPKTPDGSGSDEKRQEILFLKIRQKLPFQSEDSLIRYIPSEDGNVLAVAVEREIVNRHLAIYENANVHIKSIGIWPIALVNSYTLFFGRRQADVEAVVMLLEIDTNDTRAVICRHKNLLFARSIPVGARQLEANELIKRLVLELTACRRQFASMYKNAQIERLIFLCGQGTQNTCATIAKQLEMPAQVGDCLAAVRTSSPSDGGIDRRDCQVNWATAFGLSLS